MRLRNFSAASVLSSLLFALAFMPAAICQDADAIIRRAEELLEGKSSKGTFIMRVITPEYTREMRMESWWAGNDKALIVIRSPKREAGNKTLKIKNEIWSYLRNTETTIKIPPSMMLQPWMGSDFTNDDLVKQSSAVDDYTHRVLRTEVLNGAASYVIESIPKPDAAVVWGKILYWIRQADTIPLKQYYYNERNELVRVLTFSDVGPMGGRTIPTKWEMRPVNDPGHATVIVVKAARYDQPIDDERFTQRNLQKP